MDTTDVGRAARSAGDHPALENAARLGYAVSGLLHLLIAWLGLQLALGTGTGSADQSGALQTLAGTAVGRVLLWVAVVGFLGLGLWQLVELLARGDASDRLKSGAKTVLYLLLSATSFAWARGTGRSSSSQSVDVTASLMKEPFGRVLVAVVGVVVVGVGGYHVVKGWRRRFLDDLVSHPGRVAEAAGRIGYVAKGIALIVVGVLFVVAARRDTARGSTGLDGALRTLLALPYGQVLVALVAVGFAAYAVYSFARARHAKV
ncbi:DUF1206 domain-containing protein [Lapillicoccus sp.]|uniref:DUF1206 domain-containing protein n=1 Tax=Lapillicoccus sp. TaxID=1909287 RepID=UPI0025DF69ED|nr:DUF1206 domain-containing protein [Lapillicoccus sp.]